MEDHLNYEIDAPDKQMNELSFTKNHRFLIDISSALTSSAQDFDQPGFSKSQYGEIVMELIQDQLLDAFLLIKKSFETNYEVLGKADINTAYCTLSEQIASFKTCSSMLFSRVLPPEVNAPKSSAGNLRENTRKSFLVFKYNKYFSIKVANIAFFYIKNNTATIMTLDEQEYSLDESLDSIQSSLLPEQFFRLNRQYLINFDAIKEIEHYFSRKLFVKLVIPSPEILLVGKERATCFLNWMSQR